jgi:hypothetical protein
MGRIISYCHIRNNKISKEGSIVFEDQTGTLDDFLEKAYSAMNLSYPKFYKMDRLSKLGFLASEMLLKGKSLPESTAIVLANAHSSLDTDIRYWQTTKSQASPSLFVYTLPNIVVGEICIRHRIKGENLFFISSQFDPHCIANNVDLILENTEAKYCLAGWVDVMENHADVFLYLAEKSEEKDSNHTPEKITELYSWKN